MSLSYSGTYLRTIAPLFLTDFAPPASPMHCTRISIESSSGKQFRPFWLLTPRPVGDIPQLRVPVKNVSISYHLLDPVTISEPQSVLLAWYNSLARARITKKRLSPKPLHQTKFLLLPVAKAPEGVAPAHAPLGPLPLWDETALAWQEMQAEKTRHDLGQVPRIDQDTAESLQLYREIIVHICNIQVTRIANGRCFSNRINEENLRMALLVGSPGHIRLYHEGSTLLEYILSTFALRNRLLENVPGYTSVPLEKISGKNTVLVKEAIGMNIPSYILGNVATFRSRDVLEGGSPAPDHVDEEALLSIVLAIIGAAHCTETNSDSVEVVIDTVNRFGMRLPQFNRWSDFGDGLLGNPIAIMPTPAADFIKAKLSGATLSRPDIIQQVFLERAFADTERIVPLQACEGLGKRLIDYLCTRYIFNRYGEIDHKTVAHIRKLTKNLKTLAYAATSAEFHNYFPHGDIHPLEDYFGDIESTRKEEEDRAARQGREQGPFWVGITRTEKRLAGAVAAAHGALIISENFNPEHAERLFAATIKPLLDKYVTRDTVFFQPLIHLAVTLRGKDWEIVTVTDKTKNDVPSSWKSDLFIDGKTCVDSSEGTRNKALIACAIKAVSILKPTPAPPQSVLKDPQSDTAM